jgi:hypothetical protein
VEAGRSIPVSSMPIPSHLDPQRSKPAESVLDPGEVQLLFDRAVAISALQTLMVSSGRCTYEQVRAIGDEWIAMAEAYAELTGERDVRLTMGKIEGASVKLVFSLGVDNPSTLPRVQRWLADRERQVHPQKQSARRRFWRRHDSGTSCLDPL